ncbi:MAG: sugar ABC transporter permease [Nitrososphaerota archaeon]|nr:sugar ABC transporter permease [Nitrososphaerota archaeon]
MTHRRKNSLLSYFFVVPSLVLSSLCLLIPLIDTFSLSLQSYRLAAAIKGTFVGLQNYLSIFTESTFQVCFVNTLLLGLIGGMSTVLVALIVAVICNQDFKGNGVLVSLIVIIWAIPSIVAGRIWKILFLPNNVISQLFYAIGMFPSPVYTMLQDKNLALLTIIIASTWKFSPFAALILLGGMRSIDKTIYEAAIIDGASPSKTFRYITLPLIARYFNIALLFTTLYVTGTMDLVYAITGGGPGYATEILTSYVYKIFFLQWNFGKGSAASIILICWSLLSMGPLLLFLYRQLFRRE